MKSEFLKAFVLACMVGIGAVAMAPTADAGLGETKEEHIAKLGEPRKELKPELLQSESAVQFFSSQKNVEVSVEFKSGKAWLISYRANGSNMNSELEGVLRESNEGDSSWGDPAEHLGRKYYATNDRSAYAVRYDLGNGKVFRFCTAECMEALKAAREEKITKAIEGEIEEEEEETEEPDAEAAAEEETAEEAKPENPF